ncbi:MAG: hypothetical protein IH968_06125 [Gemmatimonadetes bacterium]|nr:hypothetical protein [Gemmatimonadota bacterium]
MKRIYAVPDVGIGPKAHVGMRHEATSSEPMNRSSDMIERLEHLGVQELTLDEQSEVLGGDGAVKWFGRAVGLIVGIIATALDGYENPRYSGQWMG